MAIEIACKDAIFHFNKKHLEDQSIPMWVIKTGGKTYYVNHVDCKMGWSTKETPDNPHTKGSIKVSKALLTINDDNEAELRQLTNGDLSRIRANKRKYARILVHNRKGELVEFLERNVMPHGPIQKVTGACGSSFDLIDIKRIEDMAMIALAFHGCYRILQPNEIYYRAYDDPSLLAQLDADEYYDGGEEELD